MVINATEKQGPDGSSGKLPTLYGYRRLRFFEIRFWEFFLLVALVLAAALALFPRHKMLVSFYLDKGMQQEALALIQDMLADTPGDTDLLKLSAEVHLSRQDGDAAIASLNRALEANPKDTQVLSRLVTLYEWNRNPKKALKILERLAGLEPDDFSVHLRLQEYYRYYGDAEREASVVFQLIRLDKRLSYSSIYPDVENDDELFRIIRDPFVKNATRELRRIALRHSSDPADPFLMEAARQLWSARTQYINWVRQKEATDPNAGQALIAKFLDIQVRMGMAPEARELAQQLDRERKSQGGIQLLLVRVLRWHAMNTEALALLAELSRSYPSEMDYLLKLVGAARQNNDLTLAITALKESLTIQPENLTLLRRLTQLFLENSQPLEAYETQKRVIMTGGEDDESFMELLAISRQTGRVALMIDSARIVLTYPVESRQVLSGAADILLESGDETGAISAYEKIVSIFPKDDTSVLKLADLYIWNNHYEKAFKLLRNAAVSSDGKELLVARMIDVAGETGSSQWLIDGLETAIALHPETKTYRLRLARLLADEGRYIEAAGAYEAYLTLYPEDYETMERLGEIYSWANRSVKAYRLYEKLLGVSNRPVKHARKLIEAAGNTGNPELMRDALIMAGEKMPNEPGLNKALAEAFLALGKQNEAIESLRRYVRSNPSDTDAGRRLVDFYLWTNRYAEAFDLLRNSPPETVLSPEYVLRLLEVAGYTGDKKRIDAAVQTAGRLFPEHPLVEKKIAEVLLAAGDTSKAILAYKRLVRLEPENTEALEQIIQLGLWSGSPQDALPWLDRRFDGAEPTAELALKASGWYLDAGSLGKAIEYAERASALRPEDNLLRRRLLEYYRWDGRQKEITATLEALLANGDLTPKEKMELAGAYTADRQWQKIINLLAPEQQTGKLDLQGAFLLIFAYENAMKKEAARAMYGQLMKRYKGMEDRLAEIGTRAMAYGRLDIALDFFETALKNNPANADALKGSGQIYAWKSQTRNAIRRLEAYSRLKPLDYEVRYQLGELYYFNGRNARALREYRRTMAIIGKAE